MWSSIWETLGSRGVTCHIRGDGGDELFYKDGVVPDAVDYARSHGLTPHLWSVALSDAMIGDTSVWQALGLAVRYGLLRRSYDWRRIYAMRDKSLLTSNVVSEVLNDDTFWHPLYRTDSRCPPGKLSQTYRLLQYTNSVDPGVETAGQIPGISPLISQPHMEFSIRTPTHILRTGGRDRALARARHSKREFPLPL